MATVHDIPCPECDAVAPVEKEGIDVYRCTDCDHQFTIDDIVGD